MLRFHHNIVDVRDLVVLFDSLKINNIIGEHVFKDRRFAGSSATIDWPKKYNKMIGAKIKLGNFNFRVDQGDFWTPNATLIFEVELIEF